jgi:hypothetical protein
LLHLPGGSGVFSHERKDAVEMLDLLAQEFIVAGALRSRRVAEVPLEAWQRHAPEPKAPATTSGWSWHTGCFLRRIMSRDASLKISELQRPPREQSRRQESFREVLGAASTPRSPAFARNVPQVRATLAGSPVASAPVAALRPVEVLGQARAAMNLEVQRMQQARGEGQAQGEQRIDSRLLDLIVKELTIEFSQQPERGGLPAAAVTELRPATPGPEAGKAPDQAGLRARAAVALVQRIETFVKSQRPAIALTVGGGIGARVEVERTGRNEIALKVKGTRGPPAPEDLARIRDELVARGLKLSSVSVG